MPEDNNEIENLVKVAMATLSKGCLKGKIKPKDVEKVIRKYVTSIQAYEGKVSGLQTEKSGLTTELQSAQTEIAGLVDDIEDYKVHASELQRDLIQEQKECASILRVYGPILAGIAKSLKPIVDMLPDDAVDSLLSKLYESGEDSPLLEALESKSYRLEQESIKQAEAEDKAEIDKAKLEAIAEYRAKYNDVHLVKIGTVANYYRKLGVAGITLTQPLSIGDKIHIQGPKTSLEQNVGSMELDHKKITEAAAGAYIGVKVDCKVSKGSTVYTMV